MSALPATPPTPAPIDHPAPGAPTGPDSPPAPATLGSAVLGCLLLTVRIPRHLWRGRTAIALDLPVQAAGRWSVLAWLLPAVVFAAVLGGYAAAVTARLRPTFADLAAVGYAIDVPDGGTITGIGLGVAAAAILLSALRALTLWWTILIRVRRPLRDAGAVAAVELTVWVPTALAVLPLTLIENAAGSALTALVGIPLVLTVAATTSALAYLGVARAARGTGSALVPYAALTFAWNLVAGGVLAVGVAFFGDLLRASAWAL